MDSGYRLDAGMGGLLAGSTDMGTADDSVHAAIIHLAATSGTAPVIIDDASLMFSGRYLHRGLDLVLVGLDGRQEIVDGYFRAEHPAALMSRTGAVLEADIVAALAGPAAPGQYAQASPGSAPAAAPVIGKVVKVSGVANVIRNGVAVALNVGDAVQKGDVVQTLKGATLGIGFNDGTAFNLTSGTRMVLNELVYDPAASNNSALFSVVQGQVSFVAGQVAHTGDMQVRTPVATMGIRGTAVRADINADNGTTHFSVLRELDGRVGSFRLTDSASGRLLGVVDSDQTTTVVTPNGTAQVLVSQIPKTAADLQQDANAVRDAFAIFSLTPQPSANQPLPGDQPGQQPGQPGGIDKPPPGQDPANPQRDGANQPLVKTAGAIGSGGGETQIHVDTTVVPLTLAGVQNTVLQPNEQTFGDVTPVLVQAATLQPGQAALNSSHLHDTGEKAVDIQLAVLPDVQGSAVASGVFTFVDTAPNFVHTASARLVGAENLVALGFSAADIAVLTAALEASVTQDSSGRADAAGTVAFHISLPNSLIHFLSAGQTLALTYGITVDDHQPTTTITHYQTFVITGTNLDPVIELAQSSAAAIAGEVGGVEAASGHVVFDDANLADTHTISLTSLTASWAGGALPQGVQDALAGALFLAGTDSTGGQQGGFAWSFHVPDADFSFLGAGETLELAYTVTIADDHGGSVDEIIRITVSGTEDAPVFSAGGTSAALAELPGVSGSSQVDSSTGTLHFSDADRTDSHTIGTSLAAVVLHESGGSIALTDAGTLAVLAGLIRVAGSEAAGAGTLEWTFSAADRTFDFLDEGQSLTLTYTVIVSDGHGGTASENVAITITGANDAPIIVAATTQAQGRLGERAGLAASALADGASGTIHFTDADAGDQHLAANSLHSASRSNGEVLSSGTLAVLREALTLTGIDATPLSPGAVGWQFLAPDKTFDFLSDGETLTIVYDVTISDGHGGTAVQPITVVVTGSVDTPVVQTGAITASTDENHPLTLTHLSAALPVGEAGDTLSVKLGVGHGTLALGSTAGLTIAADGSHGTLAFTGTQAAINIALASGVTYAPASEYEGADSLTVSATSTAADGATASTTQTVGLTVNAVAEAPILTVGTGTALHPVEGSAIKTTLTLHAGDVVSFNWDFVAHDYLPYNDFAFVTVNGVASLLSDVLATGDFGATGWRTYQYIATGDGSYTFGIGQVNDRDGLLNSHLLVDNLQVNGAVAASFESGSFSGWTVLGSASVELGHDTIHPTDGTHLAVLDSGAGTPAAIESFLGLQTGQLSTIGQASGLAHVPLAIPISLATDANSIDEMIFVTITGQPAGASFSHGTFDAGTGAWTIAAADLAGLTILTPVNYTGAFTLSVTATAVEPENGNAAVTAVQTLDVVIVSATTVFRGDLLGNVTEDSGVGNSIHGTSPVHGSVQAYHLGVAEGFVADSGTTGHGTYSVDTAGNWVFTLNQHDAAVEALTSSETLGDSFTIIAADGVQRVIAIAIQGANDLPSTVNQAFSSGVDHGLFGQIDILANDVLDPDHGAANTLSLGATPITSVTGPQGITLRDSDFVLGVDPATNKLTLTIGDSFRQLGEGETAHVTFNYTLTGNVGDVALGTATFDVVGSNESPVVDLAAADSVVIGSVTKDPLATTLTANGQIDFADVDLHDTHSSGIETFGSADPTHTHASVTGIYGTLSIGAISEPSVGRTGAVGWSYAVNESAIAGLYDGRSADETFTLVVSDNHGGFTTQDVVITLYGSGTSSGPPIVGGSPTIHAVAAVAGSDAVTLDALQNASDPQGGTLSIDLSGTTLPPGLTYNPGTHLFTFDPALYFSENHSANVTVTYNVVNTYGSTPQSASFYVDGGGQVAAVDRTVFDIDIADNGLSTNGTYVVHGVLAFDQPDLDITSVITGVQDETVPGTFTVDSVLATADPHRTLVTYTYAISQSELSDILSSHSSPVSGKVDINFAWAFGTLSQDLRVHLSSAPVTDFASAITANADAGNSTFTALSGDETKATLTSTANTLSFIPHASGYHVSVEAAAGDIGTVTASNDQAGHISWTYQVAEAKVLALGAAGTKVDDFTIVLYDGDGHATTQQVSAQVTQPETGPLAASFSPDHFYWRHSYTGPSDTTFNGSFAYFQAAGYTTSLTGTAASGSPALTLSAATDQSFDGHYFKAEVHGGVKFTTFSQAAGTFETASVTITQTDAQSHDAFQVQNFISANPVNLGEALANINTTAQAAVAADALSFGNAAILLAASGSILFLDGGGSFDLSKPVLLSGFDQLVVSANGATPGGAHVGLRDHLALDITSQNTGTQFFLADALYKFHGDGHGDEFFIENAAALHAGTVFDESVAGSGTAIHFTEGVLGGAYDLTLASIHNIDRLVLDASNDVVSVDSASIASFSSIEGVAGARLTTSHASLDLSHASISSIDVQSSAANGTAFTAGSLADASHIVANSNVGLDSLTISGAELTAGQVHGFLAGGAGGANDTFEFVRTGSSIYAGNNGAAISGDAVISSLHGSAGMDTFVFRANFGSETVTDFTAGTDKLKFASPADTADTLLATATHDPAGTTLHLHDGSSVMLTGVTLAALHPMDFIL